MPDNSVRHQMDERKMRRLREELLRRKTDEDVEYVCVRCGCAFRSMSGSITCPFCGLEYAPNIK